MFLVLTRNKPLNHNSTEIFRIVNGSSHKQVGVELCQAKAMLGKSTQAGNLITQTLEIQTADLIQKLEGYFHYTRSIKLCVSWSSGVTWLPLCALILPLQQQH